MNSYKARILVKYIEKLPPDSLAKIMSEIAIARGEDIFQLCSEIDSEAFYLDLEENKVENEGFSVIHIPNETEPYYGDASAVNVIQIVCPKCLSGKNENSITQTTPLEEENIRRIKSSSDIDSVKVKIIPQN